MKKLTIILVLLVSILVTGCDFSKQPITAQEAYNYMNDPDNFCNDNNDFKIKKYCGYAFDIYHDANNKLEEKLIDDIKIKKLFLEANKQKVDCGQLPMPTLCLAVDIRIDQISADVIRQLGISAKPEIFNIGPTTLQQNFNNRLEIEEAKKLLE